MTEQSNTDASSEEAKGQSHRERVSEGIRQGIGVLSAFKDALEETIQEARDRGDLSSDRAKEVMREALDKAQSAADEARERLDFAHQGQVESLREAVEHLQARVQALEDRMGGHGPEQADAGESTEDAPAG
jgi:polyhydroxyalkanoate synthesis regulator phasin